MRKKINLWVASCSMVLMLVMLSVGVIAASSASVGISATVTYEPNISGSVYLATNAENLTDATYYWNGADKTEFPSSTNAISFNETTGKMQIGTTALNNDNKLSLTADVFGRVTVFAKIYNTCGFNITPTVTANSSNFSIESNAATMSIPPKTDTNNEFAILSIVLKANGVGEGEDLTGSINITLGITDTTGDNAGILDVNTTSYIATNGFAQDDATYSNYYFDDATMTESQFPVNNPAFGDNNFAFNNTTTLTCDVFGRVVVYIKVFNSSTSAVVSNVSISSASGVSIAEVTNVFLNSINTQNEPDSGIVKLVLVASSTTATAINVNVKISFEKVANGNTLFNESLQYSLAYSSDGTNYKTDAVEKTNESCANALYGLIQEVIEEDVVVQNAYKFTSAATIKIKNNSTGKLYYTINNGAEQSVNANAEMSAINVVQNAILKIYTK